MDINSKVNQPEAGGGTPAVMRTLAALAVVVVAIIGVLAVLGVIPTEALQEWGTKVGLILLIVIAAALAIAVLAKSGKG